MERSAIQRSGKAVSNALILIALLTFGTPISLTYNALIPRDVDSHLLPTRSNTMTAMASSAPTEDPEPWRFSFTRFTDVPTLAYYRASASIALDSRNFPHISFVYGDYLSLKHAFYNGVQWIVETVDDVCPLESAIAVDSYDYAHVTYTVYTDGIYDPYQARVKYACYNGTSWTTEVLDENGFWSSIAIDSQDSPHVTYFNGSGLQYAFFDGSTWTKETVDGTCLNGLSRPFIALDNNAHPRIVYSGQLTDTNGPLKYASFDGSSWNIQTIDAEGYAGSISLDSSGNPNIAYSNATALKYAYFNGASWNIEVIAYAQAQSATSIAVDSEFRPHVVYKSGASIKYAYYGYNSWNITTINEDKGYDPGPWGSGGWYSGLPYYSPSLSIGSDDKLRLSYIAGKYGDELRYGVGTKQYLTNFEFNDDSGNALYSPASLVVASCRQVPEMPLIQVQFTTFSNQWLDCSDWTLTNVLWQGSNVEPVDATYTPVLDGTWKVRARVYALNIKNRDQFGNVLTQSVNLSFPNGTAYVKQPIHGWINLTQVQTGNIEIGTPISVSKSEQYVLLNATGINLTGNTILDSLIWRHETTTLKVSCGPSTTYVGFHVNVSGRLTNMPEGDIPEATIILTYRVPGVSDWNLITSSTTRSDGTFSVVWIPSATGYYTVNASWAGNDKYLEASGIVNLAVIPVADEYVFSVASNSTISALSFNSTSRELTFTVSGLSGTTGYVDAIIAKTLISDITDVKVFIDGEKVNCTAVDRPNSWILHTSCGLSTHTVTINLGPAPSTSPQLVTLPNIIIIAVGLSIAVGLAVGILKMRKGRPSPKAKKS